MKSYVLDIYLADVNREYLNKLSFLTLTKSRSLGYRRGSDLISEAYKYFDNQYCDETLKALESYYVFRKIVEKYQIEFKEDLVYLVRHPTLLNNKPDYIHRTVRKKVLHFYDIDEPENAYKREAYEYLNSMKPVRRAPLIDRMLTQYMIKTRNEYYISQASARLLDNLIELCAASKRGDISGQAKDMIDAIWNVGANLTDEEM